MSRFRIVFCGVLFSLCATAENLTDDSFAGVFIGMKETDALRILKNYKGLVEPGVKSGNCHFLESIEDKLDLPSFMVEEGVITRIDVTSKYSEVRTSRNIRVGYSSSKIIEKYGQPVSTPHPYTGQKDGYQRIKQENGLVLLFEIEGGDGVISSIRLGTPNAVEYIEGCL